MVAGHVTLTRARPRHSGRLLEEAEVEAQWAEGTRPAGQGQGDEGECPEY